MTTPHSRHIPAGRKIGHPKPVWTWDADTDAGYLYMGRKDPHPVETVCAGHGVYLDIDTETGRLIGIEVIR